MKQTNIDASKLIKYWLTKTKTSNTELANGIGVTVQRVTKLTSKENARTDMISRLAHFFKVKPSDFIKPAENNYK